MLSARGGEGGQEVGGVGGVGGGWLGGAETLSAGALHSVPRPVPAWSQPGAGLPSVAQTDQDDGVDQEEAGARHQAHQDQVGEAEGGALALGLATAGHHHGLLAAQLIKTFC